MPISILRRTRIGVSLGAVFMFLFLLPAASEGAVSVDLRVVDTDGFTMAQQTQFTDTVIVKTSPEADCFGPPGGSGAEKTLNGPTALGAVWDASQADADLRPIWLTDQFGFGLGLCAIGGKEPTPSGFWYLKINHVGSQVGGDQATVGAGDDVLWYLTPNFPPGDELELVGPELAQPGEPFQVQVFSYTETGEKSPAAGALVSGAFEPTDVNGFATVTPASSGTVSLQATRGVDIPSNLLDVTVSAELDACAATSAEEIVGSGKRDKISGTQRPETITARGGRDRVNSVGGCADQVDCGSGKDRAKVDPTDAVRRCNKVKVR
jgi:hypothetical protein